MHVSILGTGYVGLPAGAGLASKGHEVTCVDIDESKVESINRGECPIYEEELPELLDTVVKNGALEATTDARDAILGSDVTFLAVGTPMQEDGSIDLGAIRQAARDAGSALAEKDGYHVFVVKSTVVPRTTEETIISILEEESGRTAGREFGVCMNPEFLREGTALADFLDPDRIVIGQLDERSGDLVAELYEEFDAPIMRTSLRAAELIKYASNALLATKISFINEMGNICKELGIDVYEVADGVGLDHRIERQFLDAGCGFGGSCFPKDVRAIMSLARDELDVRPRILESVIETNEAQKKRLAEMLRQRMDPEGKRVAVLGLSFKPGTDDIRKSPAIQVIGELKADGAEVVAYDPKAVENMRAVHADVEYAGSAREALEGADACLLVTDWEEFGSIEQEAYPEITLEGRRMDRGEGICW